MTPDLDPNSDAKILQIFLQPYFAASTTLLASTQSHTQNASTILRNTAYQPMSPNYVCM